MADVDRTGKTWQEAWDEWTKKWATFDRCKACGEGIAAHEPVLIWGKWFAHCLKMEAARA